MAPALPLPGGPVPVQELGIDSGSYLARFFGIPISLSAVLIGAAFRVNLAGEHQVSAVWRINHAIRFSRKVGDLLGVAAVRIHLPDLRGAAAIGNVSDSFGIGRPPRALVCVALMRDRPW